MFGNHLQHPFIDTKPGEALRASSREEWAPCDLPDCRAQGGFRVEFGSWAAQPPQVVACSFEAVSGASENTLAAVQYSAYSLSEATHCHASKSWR